MTDIKLRVVSKPVEGSRLLLETEAGGSPTIIEGQGNINLLCGNCSAILAEGIESGQLQDVVLHCAACGSYNDVI